MVYMFSFVFSMDDFWCEAVHDDNNLVRFIPGSRIFWLPCMWTTS